MPMSMMDQPSCSRDMENVVAANGEPVEKDSASTKVSDNFGIVRVHEELDKVVRKLRGIPAKVEEELAEARIAGKYRMQLDNVVGEEVKKACQALEGMKQGVAMYHQFGQELSSVLRAKGIESIEDMNDFVSTTEMDGEIVAMLSEIFNKDLSQAREALREVQSLKEVQDRSKAARIVEPMETDFSEDKTERGRSCDEDWKSLRAALESAFGTLGQKHKQYGASKGAARTVGYRSEERGNEAECAGTRRTAAKTEVRISNGRREIPPAQSEGREVRGSASAEQRKCYNGSRVGHIKRLSIEKATS
ncbi:hypothetical protein GCK32_019620 [Trichostrongylus colubriformis]|uniref:Uncharacterized protein n=1 Tax=Trichostrongylus colubriformis TaxID=6319 RepID=A0AAN8F7V4_TRICO